MDQFKALPSFKPTFLTPEDIVRFWSTVSFTFPSNSAVFRRSKLIAIGKFHPKMEIYADWFACHALALENGMLPAKKFELAIFDTHLIFCKI